MTRAFPSSGAGTRTQNLRINSPPRCRLRHPGKGAREHIGETLPESASGQFTPQLRRATVHSCAPPPQPIHPLRPRKGKHLVNYS